METKKIKPIEAQAIREYVKLIEKLKELEKNRKPKDDKDKIWIDYINK